MSMKSMYHQLRLNHRSFLSWSHRRHVHSHEQEVLPMKKLNIISYAPAEYRNSMISQIESVVTTCGGYVDDFNFFSDIAVSLRILGLKQPDTLREFFQRLRSDIAGLRLDKETITTLQIAVSNSDRYNLFILLQILFINAKGELRQMVPTVNS